MSSFTKSLLTALLLSGGVLSATITPAPKATCAANCAITMHEFGHWWWKTIVVTTTYTHTVILIVDEEHHTTKTSTILVAIPATEILNKPYETNSAGTVTKTVAKNSGTTILAYPTQFINYPAGYKVSGTFNSSAKCYTNPSITWKTKDLTSLTQPPVSIPSGGDKFGTLYSLTVTKGSWPRGWLDARLEDTLPSDCDLASIAPAVAVQGALLLTSTSISTIKDTRTSTPSPTKATSRPKETTPLAAQDSSKTTTTTVVIGSTTVPVSWKPLGSGISSQAIVIGTQTVVVGSTVIVGGMTVVATTGTDSAPQIIYGTTTVLVAPAATSEDSVLGSYIMSGIAGPQTTSGSGASSTSKGPALQTGAAVKIGNGLPGNGVWYTLIMALLSIF